jgi:hypothetical protein
VGKCKYSSEDVQKIIELKKQFLTNKEISEKTGATLYFIKEVVKANQLYIPKEKLWENVKRGKVEKSGNFLPSQTDRYKNTMSSRSIELKQKILELIKDSKITLVEFTQGTRHTDHIFNCQKHGDFKRNFYRLKNTQTCPKCVLNVKPQHQHYTYEDAKKFIEDRGHELVSTEYVDSRSKLLIRCKKHGVFKMPLYAFNNGQDCRGCSGAKSKPELEVFDYIKQLQWKYQLPICVINRDRELLDGFEIDILIKERKLAIEYDGLYTHSQVKNKIPERFVQKYKKIEKSGLKLFAIYGDEWDHKKELVKGMIRHRLGIYETKLRASSLQVVKYTENKYIQGFFDKFHIDGHVRSSFAYALLFKGEIVSCMSFRRNMESGMLEIARFASNYDYMIYGAFSKLLKQYDRKEPLLSYSNNRVGNGDVYRNHGFKQIIDKNSDKPGYYYTDFKKRVFRTKCQKINDPEIVSKYPTEEDQALAGILSEPFGHSKPIYKIYDYGKKKWILE